MTLPSAICACCRLRWLVLAWSRVCYTYPTNVFFGRYTPTPLLYAHQHRYTGPTIGPQTIWRSSTRNWYTSGLCRICQLPSNASWLTSSSLNLIQEPKRSVSNLISVSFTVVFFNAKKSLTFFIVILYVQYRGGHGFLFPIHSNL